MLCLHGFPECWASWRYQLPALAQSGYHAVAPDLRGYGETGGPADVDAYRQSRLAEDVVALIDALGAERAVLVGHDWGCALSWEVARRHPDRVAALVGLSVPYGGPAPQPPTRAMRDLFGDHFFYMLYFQRPEVPERELEADVEDSLRRLFHSLSADGIDDFRVAPDDTRVLAAMRPGDAAALDARRGSGLLRGPFPQDRLHRRAQLVPGHGRLLGGKRGDDHWTLDAPTLFLGGMQDPVVLFSQKALARMPDYVPDLTTVMLDQCGHWIQMEQAVEVNREILNFLAAKGLQPPG